MKHQGWLVILAAAVAVISIFLWGYFAGGQAFFKQQPIVSRMISADRLKDRRGHVGHSAVTKINLYEQYVDTLRDDMEGAKSDIAALGDRFQVIMSKINQLETALDAEKKRVNERMRSIERDRQQLLKVYGGCR